MRQIEKKMIEAVSNRKTWRQANTSTKALADRVAVYLHGNHIADVYRSGQVEPNLHTFALWKTRTTCSRLKALGVDARIKNFVPHINGQPI